MRPGPVDERTAVGADAAPQETPRRRRYEFVLPWLEQDPPLVLLARTVLREKARQVP